MNVPHYPLPCARKASLPSGRRCRGPRSPCSERSSRIMSQGRPAMVGIQSRRNEPPSPPVKSGLTRQRDRPPVVAPTPSVFIRTPPNDQPQRAALLPAKSAHVVATAFAMHTGPDRTTPLATSRCRDVCSIAARDARIAIVGLDRRHDRFGRPGGRYLRDCFATVAVVASTVLPTPPAIADLCAPHNRRLLTDGGRAPSAFELVSDGACNGGPRAPNHADPSDCRLSIAEQSRRPGSSRPGTRGCTTLGPPRDIRGSRRFPAPTP